MKSETDVWRVLYDKCVNIICTNVLYVIQYHRIHFLELKYFQDPFIHEVSEEEEMAKQFGRHEEFLIKQAVKDLSKESMESETKKCKNICDLILTKVIFSNWLNQNTFDFT